MSTLKGSRIPPPESWEEFEKLCADLFRRIWEDPGTQRNGRRGQPQHGVDVFGRPLVGEFYAGVQAKNKVLPPNAVTVMELRSEVEKAKKFVPELKSFILATTAPNDAVIQEEARQITAAHHATGLFSVEVWGWDELQNRLVEHPDVLKQHYPDLAGFADELLESTRELVRLKTEELKWAEEKDRPTFERTDGATTTMFANFQPTWRMKQSSGDYVPNLQWRFCGPRFEMEWRDADGSSLGRTSVAGRFDLSTAEISEHPCLGLDEVGLEVRFSWRGKMRHEIHRWPFKYSENSDGRHCEAGRELLPVLRLDEEL